MDTVSDNLNDTSAERAQRQLDDLRSAVEVRLHALETVLADPGRGESLESLILDLSRVATEEARAAALKVCLDAKLEADTRVIHARAVAQEAVDQERITSGELRRELDQTRQRVSALENHHISQLHQLREELEGEIARERSATARLDQAATENSRRLEVELASGAELRQLLDRERATTSELRQALEAAQQSAGGLQHAAETERATASELRLAAERAQEASAKATREKADSWAAQEALTRDLARERDGVAKLQRLNADLRSQLDAERAAAAELKQAAERTAEDLATAATGHKQSAANVEELQSEINAMRTESGALRVDLEAAGARLEMLDAERLRADRARKELEARLESLAQDRDRLTAELESVRRQAADASRTSAVTTPSTPVGPVGPVGKVPAFEDASVIAGVESPKAIAPTAAPVPDVQATSLDAGGPRKTDKLNLPTEEEWGAVRLAVRYAFRDPVAIQINGDAGMLVDLSVAGCQFVSTTAIRPNQFVKVTLPREGSPLACAGKVMWARFEPKASGGSIGYRAGLHFTKPDQGALEEFISASRLPPPQ